MTNFNKEKTTEYLLKFCYNCEDACTCDTEEKCRECWAQQGLLEGQEQDETQYYLDQVHA
ncbi:hypothetical protein [Paenibacillus sp.]|jgi:hypothetical protein|uniref:hypothetical protein n=1 Tax=Paenibacillus sp. TaxID=58172 RepID=UPI00281BAB07|nr:hypothetical protein [Paenibacillus sp.]MDR0267560.1 hypothetical protein [Paenibacillus sp.]